MLLIAAPLCWANLPFELVRKRAPFLSSQNQLTNPLNVSSYAQLNRSADATEKRLITEVYDFAKSIAELQLTESELALYSALVLLQPGKSSRFRLQPNAARCDDERVSLTSEMAFPRTRSDRPDLRQVNHVRRLNLFIGRSLRNELNKTHSRRSLFDEQTGLNVYDLLIAKIPLLREISMLHMSALSRFRRIAPEIEFPALHRELFSLDMISE